MREVALVPKSARSTGVQSARSGRSAVGRHSDERKRLHEWVARGPLFAASIEGLEAVCEHRW